MVSVNTETMTLYQANAANANHAPISVVPPTGASRAKDRSSANAVA